jgi:hypothetical protein
VNSEASPDGHAWATSAFSTEYVDKAFRWECLRTGPHGDYEGFNRLPGLIRPTAAAAAEASAHRARHLGVPQALRALSQRIARRREPESLYLWDAAAKAGLSYRTYGEFVSTLSSRDVDSLNAKRSNLPGLVAQRRCVRDESVARRAFQHGFRNFDLTTPDAITTEATRRPERMRRSTL